MPTRSTPVSEGVFGGGEDGLKRRFQVEKYLLTSANSLAPCIAGIGFGSGGVNRADLHSCIFTTCQVGRGKVAPCSLFIAHAHPTDIDHRSHCSQPTTDQSPAAIDDNSPSAPPTRPSASRPATGAAPDRAAGTRATLAAADVDALGAAEVGLEF